jgi:hypothetical protein
MVIDQNKNRAVKKSLPVNILSGKDSEGPIH